jgi:hypothetical protein
MLSDRDRERLREIRRRMMAEDPEFVRALVTKPVRSEAAGAGADAYTVGGVGAISLSVILLLAGQLGISLLLAVCAALVWMAEPRRRAGE